jgi:V8-like Glu-specific endopeptidase
MLKNVVLDPGHGGAQRRGNSTPDGARFGSGQLEQQINYALAQRVAHHLGGAHLTRGERENCSLGERVEYARHRGAEAFVSLHTSGGVGGSDVWVHPRSGPASAQLAEMIRAQLSPAFGGRSGGVSRAELAVLSPEHHDRRTAACLVDLGYLGGRDGRGLADPAALETAAAAIARGVRGHLGRRSGYGPRAALDRGLDVSSPILSGSADDRIRMLTDWIKRQVTFVAGVADTSVFPFSAICRLEMQDGGWGTGFYISTDRILTAGHVTTGQTAIDVVPGKNGAGVEPFGRFTVSGASNIITHPRYTPSGDFDLGVIVASAAPPNDAYFSHLDAVPHSVAEIAICGYASDVGDDHRQHVDVDQIRNVSANLEQADYAASTMPGTSGSPVFYTIQDENGEPWVSVVGVHVSSAAIDPTQAGTQNMCVRLTDPKLNWIWSL